MANRGTQCCAFGCNKRRKPKLNAEAVRSASEGSADEESERKQKFARTFHSFPLDPERVQTWKKNIRRENWTPSKYSRICSDHFKEEVIDRSTNNVKLTKDAVPTRFKTFPKHLKQVPHKNRRAQSTQMMKVADDNINKEPVPNIDISTENKASTHDHSYSINSSPKTLKTQLNKSHDYISKLNRKLKTQQQKSRILKSKVTTLKQVVKQLKKNNLISDNCQEQLHQSLSGVSLALMDRIISKKKGKGGKYPPELKSFALTLQFYSSKAYEFVRQTLNLALPHQSHIRKWYSKIPAAPGFTQPAFVAIKTKVDAARETGNNIVCALMLDEMAIRKQISWDGKQYAGYIDLGNGLEDDDSAPVAKDALVLMVVSVNGSWKVPCGYFFLDGLSGVERANLVNVCLQRLWDTGAEVASVTFDGPSCHFTMSSELGANLTAANLKPYFPHPVQPEKKVHIFMDVCHMLKLVRNTLGDGGIIVDDCDKKIFWKYIDNLHKLQDNEGLRLGNKLKTPHIRWRQQKMKVNLAAQTFSSSVADAIEYCTSTLKLPQFQGSEATVKFIRLFDRLFDILNSRNPLGKGYKSPLRIANKNSWNPFLDRAYKYISNLKDTTGKFMHQTKRKTGFIGFLVAIRSTQNLFANLVERDEAPLKYMLTYKFSQDHLELFFAAVRSAGGFNNNPTTQQFTAAYKRLLMRSSIQGGKGNCERQDLTDILYVISDNCAIDGQEISISEASIIRKYNLTERQTPVNFDHVYFMPNISKLSEYKKAAISYIAGYVAGMVEKKILCSKCCKALGSKNHAPTSSFLALKDRGGLLKPTESVVVVCEETEKRFERMMATTKGKLPRIKGIPGAISLSVLQDMNMSKVFTELNNHMLETAVTDNHLFSLIKNISQAYCKIKLFHMGKETTDKLSETKIRKKLCKLVLFKHQ
ncbi:DNA transposase THAP9 [Nymphon striatum]|nr:DNA transposase THAP9 [Nymphon striatum]